MHASDRRRRKARADSLIGVHEAATLRLRGALHGREKQPWTAIDDPLLLEAERRVRRTIRWRRTLPLNLILLLPSVAFAATRSKLVLAVFVFAYPLAFVLRALLARALSAWIGSEDILIRREVERLRSRRAPVAGSDRPRRP